MGFLDRLRGIKRPKSGAATQTKEELQRRLLSLNHEKVPFVIGPGTESDLQAEWKIVDAEWYEIFAKANLEKTHRILLRLDDAKREVRALEQSSSIEWRAGVPSFSFSTEKHQGRTLASKSFGSAYAFTGVNPLKYGEAYNYRFDVSEMKDPIVDTVTAGGWSWVPVTTKRGVTSDQ